MHVLLTLEITDPTTDPYYYLFVTTWESNQRIVFIAFANCCLYIDSILISEHDNDNLGQQIYTLFACFFYLLVSNNNHTTTTTPPPSDGVNLSPLSQFANYVFGKSPFCLKVRLVAKNSL